ncbi:hypothetical protein NW762_004192 [Fusarium torreyae]|uniref:AB hydrolase-1 domain-containing protein n=1 Tax=Fusarium torreyae TaxID=1237075 RepID=A0A9W8VHW1_9HYPO|nr:hypothetical protein NW762_004192 [Fusarium torreyae]
MTHLHPAVQAVIVAVGAPLGLYCVFLGLGMTPFFQRQFLYAHKFNTLFWNDVNQPQRWGFARNQVTPFNLKTPDGEYIYAWHILPLPLYLKNEASIEAQESGLVEDFTKTESFRLLKEDPESRLVLYYPEQHRLTSQNAGHIAQAIRPLSYHSLTDTSSYHVIAIDYRGFGHSTGSPSETGVIQDAATLVEWATKVAEIPASRIVLLGQSLGTAVVSAVAEKYALQGVEFAGITIVAGFSDLANLLLGYRIVGIFPVLAPFRMFPSLMRFIHRFVVDKWHSDQRLANIVRHTKTRLRINLVHAKDDSDIPWTEDNKLFRAAAQETIGIMDDDEFANWKEQRTIRKGKDAFVTTWEAEPNMIIRQELFPHGGK